MSHNLHPPLYRLPPIPVGKSHPGAFGIDRHLHVHTGVDLYAPYGSPVLAIETGKVIKIAWFTGSSISMPWWRNTRAVYIEGETGVFNYGEIQEYQDISEGDTIKMGQDFGYVIPVLKKYKGRPMSMLHLELYDHGYVDDWGEWKIGDPKPEHLKDPTPYLISIPGSIPEYEDPFLAISDNYKKSGRHEIPSPPISFCEVSACDLNNGSGTCFGGLCPETCYSRRKNCK